MSASLATIVRPEAANRTNAFFRLVVSSWEAITGYFVRRSAIATLHELDDRALRDIGIVRPQIEAAVQGFVTLPDRTRMS
jgi:uncharacterized protein YjiS (DUF1127 family)